MTDHVRVTGLLVEACHGVLAHEKVQSQPFVVDLDIEADLSRAGRTDDLAWTINYAEVAQQAEAILRGEPVDLIEHLAERIAEVVLRQPLAEAVEVTVHKPQAPAGVPLTEAALAGPSVTVRRERDVPVVVAAGANLGAREATLRSAIRTLDRTPGIAVVAVADAVETDPVGGPDQPDYLNTVVLARTRLSPWSLLDTCHRIERAHRRTREIRWGARTLDLDIIQYGDPSDHTDRVSDAPDLTLPHPRAHERGFVLAPWAAVDPGASLRVGDRIRFVGDLLESVDLEGVRSTGVTLW